MQFLGKLLGSSDQELSATERRSAWRLKRRVGLFGYLANKDKLILTGIDFGPGGACVESAKPLRVGDKVTLRIVRKDVADDAPLSSHAKILLEARVVWVRKRPRAPGYLLGMMFPDGPESGAVTNFLIECGAAVRNPREKRKSPRMALRLPGFLRTPRGDMLDIEVQDLAVGGACVKVRTRVDLETKVSLKIILPRDKPALDLHAVVVRVRPDTDGDAWNLGMVFVGVAPKDRDRLIAYLSELLKKLPQES